jgi:hypothetical protein
MRNILFSAVGSILLMALFGGCTVTAKAPSGRTAAIGVKTQR